MFGTFGFNNTGNHGRGDGFNIGRVRHIRVGHNRGRVGVYEDDAITLCPQGFAGLGAGIIKLAGLTDDNRPRADDDNRVNICSFGHDFLGGRGEWLAGF